MEDKQKINHHAFEKIVNLHEEFYILGKEVYSKVTNACNQLDFSKVDEKFVFKYVINFLTLWGQLGRSALRIDCEELAIRMREKLPFYLNQLNGETLVHIHLEDQKAIEAIQQIYEELKKIDQIGATTISKIMHILDSDLFIMWDDKIRKKHHVAGSKFGYIKFMNQMKDFAEQLLQVYSRKLECNMEEAESFLTKKYDRPMTRLLDIYNWLTADPKRKDRLERLEKIEPKLLQSM